MASASIRGGSSEDREKTKVFIEELVNNQPSAVFRGSSAKEDADPIKVDFVNIDWQQLAKDCVSLTRNRYIFQI